MVKQRTDSPTNTPEDWVFLAERDLNVANHLATTMHPTPTEKFLQKEIPELFKAQEEKA